MKQIALSLFFWPPMEVWYLDLRILLCVFFLVQCLNKPYPGVWLEGIVNKSQKPSRTLQTNRQTSPLDPNYILPSGPSIMPSGEKVSTQVLPFPSLPFPTANFWSIQDQSSVQFGEISDCCQIPFCESISRLKHIIVDVHRKCPLSSAYEICNSVGRDLYFVTEIFRQNFQYDAGDWWHLWSKTATVVQQAMQMLTWRRSCWGDQRQQTKKMDLAVCPLSFLSTNNTHVTLDVSYMKIFESIAELQIPWFDFTRCDMGWFHLPHLWFHCISQSFFCIFSKSSCE